MWHKKRALSAQERAEVTATHKHLPGRGRHGQRVMKGPAPVPPTPGQGCPRSLPSCCSPASGSELWGGPGACASHSLPPSPPQGGCWGPGIGGGGTGPPGCRPLPGSQPVTPAVSLSPASCPAHSCLFHILARSLSVGIHSDALHQSRRGGQYLDSSGTRPKELAGLPGPPTQPWPSGERGPLPASLLLSKQRPHCTPTSSRLCTAVRRCIKLGSTDHSGNLTREVLQI